MTNLTEETLKKEEALKKNLAALESIALAYSGGVDSTYLADVASEVLGAKLLLLLNGSPSMPRSELAGTELESDDHPYGRIRKRRVPKKRRRPLLCLQIRPIRSNAPSRRRTRNRGTRPRRECGRRQGYDTPGTHRRRRTERGRPLTKGRPFKNGNPRAQPAPRLTDMEQSAARVSLDANPHRHTNRPRRRSPDRARGRNPQSSGISPISRAASRQLVPNRSDTRRNGKSVGARRPRKVDRRNPGRGIPPRHAGFRGLSHGRNAITRPPRLNVSSVL